MALTRKMLKAMGIEDEKIEMIIDAHTEVTDTLKKERDDAKEELSKAKPEKPVAVKDTEEYKALKLEYDNYKNSVSEKETKAAKESAVRAYFEDKKITGKNLDIAMRGCREEINAIKLKDGKIEDASTLDALVAGDFAGLVVTTSTKGANTATPPANSGNSKKTKEEIMAIKDAGERQKAIAENHELFGI